MSGGFKNAPLVKGRRKRPAFLWWVFSVAPFGMGQELCLHCFSRYSAGLIGLVVGGLVVNQPDESPFLRNLQGRDTHNQALSTQLRRTRLASGSCRHCGSSEEGPLPRLGGQGRFPRRYEVLCIFSSFFACFVIFCWKPNIPNTIMWQLWKSGLPPWVCCCCLFSDCPRRILSSLFIMFLH